MPIYSSFELDRRVFWLEFSKLLDMLIQFVQHLIVCLPMLNSSRYPIT